MCSHSSAVRGRMQALAAPTAALPLDRIACGNPASPARVEPDQPHRLPNPPTGESCAGPSHPQAPRGAILAAPCARGGIGRRARLRALWRLFSVVVRVHSGAYEKPCKSGLFVVKAVSRGARGDCSVLCQWHGRTICRTFRVPVVRLQGQRPTQMRGPSDHLEPNKMCQMCHGQRAHRRGVRPSSEQPGGAR